MPPQLSRLSMWWWKVAVGLAIVCCGIREMFQDLFHPTESGRLSEWFGRTLFRILRRWPSVLPSAGPLAVVLVIFAWAFLLVIGFAFIYWAAFPGNFKLNTTNQPTDANGFWWAFYYSLEILTTLGLGDIQPNPNWLRILSGCHTLIGFSLVTSSITWIILLFPALRRLRTLARKAHILATAEAMTGVSVAATGMHVVLAGLAEEVVRTRVDLVHFPVLFYFFVEDRRASIADAVFPLMRFAADGCQHERDDLVRLAARALDEALHDLAEYFGERLSLDDRSPERAFSAFAELHLTRDLPPRKA